MYAQDTEWWITSDNTVKPWLFSIFLLYGLRMLLLNPNEDWEVSIFDCMHAYDVLQGLEVNREKRIQFSERLFKFNVFFCQFEWISSHLNCTFLELAAPSQKAFASGRPYLHCPGAIQSGNFSAEHPGVMSPLPDWWVLLGMGDKMIRISGQLGVFSRSQLL